MSPESCFNVTIIDSVALEMLESFFVMLQRPDDLDERISINTTRDEMEVGIFDGDSEYCRIDVHRNTGQSCEEASLEVIVQWFVHWSSIHRSWVQSQREFSLYHSLFILSACVSMNNCLSKASSHYSQ